ncbi:unnamed protein product [Somion occarium]|uniref:Inositol-pentakisphosphate 2-kinase n=1 Tax=Somion occarium TaxID=3059160 RepID=A0ABP1CFL0_9APHY
MSANVTSTSPSDWKYVSEGGSSIVFSYVGAPSPDFDGTALRLRKVAHYPISPETIVSEDIEEQEDPTILFQCQVIQRLIPSEYLPRLESVDVEGPWLEELARLAEEHRPLERRAKDKIDVRRRKAVLANDLVGGSGWAVEIKWGFLPNPTHLSPSTKVTKSQTCRFCMHSHLKTTEGEDASLGYCPLDLYSGEEKRVRKALDVLWDAWVGSSGGVNNFKIFVEGHMLRPTTFPSSLGPIAHQVFSANAAEPSLDTLRDQVISPLLPLLLETPVLRILSTHQRNLDALDIEGLSSLWSETHKPAGSLEAAPVPPLGKGLSQPTIEELENFVDVYLEKHASMDHNHPDTADLRYYCIAYLLSATFKDCSIILRLHPAVGNTPARSSITVIDLDVKSIDRLPTWEKLDQKVVKAYAGVSQPTRCYDRWAPARL